MEDKIFLPSRTQVFGHDLRYDSMEPEDEQLLYYMEAKHRVKSRTIDICNT